MMRPASTTQVAGAKKSGEAKWKDGVAAGAKDVGPPTMVTKNGPSRIDLSPNLANVSALVECMEGDSALTSVLEQLPGPDLGIATPGRAPLFARTTVTILVPSLSSTSIACSAS